MPKLLILGSNELVNRLPEALAHSNTEIHVLARPKSVLRKSSFVTKFFPIHGELVDPPTFVLNPELESLIVGSNYDLYVTGDDLLVLGVLRSNIPEEIKSKFLPVRNPSYRKMIASKVGFIQTAQDLKMPIPESFIAVDNSELVALASKFEGPFVIKGDFSGGGAQVRKMHSNHLEELLAVPKSWFPVVAQEFVDGDIINIDSFFLEGSLAGWVYAKTTREANTYGPSTSRQYLNPNSLDFEPHLQLMGEKAGLHGFLNTTWIWSEEQNTHFLIEADPRPNAWHQHSKKFGVDWAVIFASSAPKSPLRQRQLENGGVSASLFPRELQSSLNSWDIKTTLKWVLHKPGTWEFRNLKDSKINRHENLAAALFVRSWFLKVGARIWQSLPKQIQKRLVSLRIKSLVTFLLGA